VRVMGNAKARAVYESELPPLFRRPQTDQSLAAFIRQKYEQKRYILRDWSPPKVDVSDLPQSAEAVKKAQTAKVSPGSRAVLGSAPAPTPTPAAEPAVLVDLFSMEADPVPSAVNGSHSTGLEGLVGAQQSSVDDLFGPIVSAPTATVQAQSQSGFADFSSVNTAPTSNSEGLDDIFGSASGVPHAQTSPVAQDQQLGSISFAQPESKKTNMDILSLFGSSRPSAPLSSIPIQQQTFPTQHSAQFQSNANPPASMINSGGLFGTGGNVASGTVGGTGGGLDDLLAQFKM